MPYEREIKKGQLRSTDIRRTYKRENKEWDCHVFPPATIEEQDKYCVEMKCDEPVFSTLDLVDVMEGIYDG